MWQDKQKQKQTASECDKSWQKNKTTICRSLEKDWSHVARLVLRLRGVARSRLSSVDEIRAMRCHSVLITPYLSQLSTQRVFYRGVSSVQPWRSAGCFSGSFVECHFLAKRLWFLKQTASHGFANRSRCKKGGEGSQSGRSIAVIELKHHRNSSIIQWQCKSCLATCCGAQCMRTVFEQTIHS